MSIWTDNAVKELQMKVAWLEKEVAELKKLKDAGPSRLSLPNKGKPS